MIKHECISVAATFRALAKTSSEFFTAYLLAYRINEEPINLSEEGQCQAIASRCKWQAMISVCIRLMVREECILKKY